MTDACSEDAVFGRKGGCYVWIPLPFHVKVAQGKSALRRHLCPWRHINEDGPGRPGRYVVLISGRAVQRIGTACARSSLGRARS